MVLGRGDLQAQRAAMSRSSDSRRGWSCSGGPCLKLPFNLSLKLMNPSVLVLPDLDLGTSFGTSGLSSFVLN